MANVIIQMDYPLLRASEETDAQTVPAEWAFAIGPPSVAEHVTHKGSMRMVYLLYQSISTFSGIPADTP